MPEVQLKSATARSETFTRIDLGNRERGHPWMMTFVFAPNGNFLVTGDSNKVHEYIRERWPRCLYNNTCWQFGECRSYWGANGIYVTERDRQRRRFWDSEKSRQTRNHTFFAGAPKSARWHVGAMKGNKCFHYRRLPHRWLPEWDTLLDNPEPSRQPPAKPMLWGTPVRVMR